MKRASTFLATKTLVKLSEFYTMLLKANNSNRIKNSVLRRNTMQTAFLSLLFLFTGIINGYGQSPCPEDVQCTSGDIVVLGGELIDRDGNILTSSTCLPNTFEEVFIRVNLDVTSQTRYGFRMMGTLIMDGIPEDFDRCIERDLTQGPHAFYIGATDVYESINETS